MYKNLCLSLYHFDKIEAIWSATFFTHSTCGLLPIGIILVCSLSQKHSHMSCYKQNICSGCQQQFHSKTCQQLFPVTPLNSCQGRNVVLWWFGSEVSLFHVINELIWKLFQHVFGQSCPTNDIPSFSNVVTKWDKLRFARKHHYFNNGTKQNLGSWVGRNLGPLTSK